MAWIDKLENETAAALKTRLDGLGAKIELEEQSTSSIANASANQVLRQIQTVRSWEYRSLTKAAAVLLRGCAYDNTTSSMRYAFAGTLAKSKSGSVSASVTTGTVLHVSASRADESNRWVARFTETTYSVSDGGWTTTEPAASSAGHVTSMKKSKLVNRFSVNGTVLLTVMQTVTVTVTEYPYLSSATADSMCSNPTDTMQMITVTAYDANQNLHSFQYSAGSVVSFEKRFVSEADGWTVTKTEENRSNPNNNNNN